VHFCGEKNFKRIFSDDITKYNTTPDLCENKVKIHENTKNSTADPKILEKIESVECYFALKNEEMKKILEDEKKNQGLTENQFLSMQTLFLKELNQYCCDVVNILKNDTETVSQLITDEVSKENFDVYKKVKMIPKKISSSSVN